jgi:hypothetical protein
MFPPGSHELCAGGPFPAGPSTGRLGTPDLAATMTTTFEPDLSTPDLVTAARAVAAAADAIDVITRAAAAETEADPAFLVDYLSAALAAARAGRRLDGGELAACSRAGQDAADQGVPLATVVDLYLSATWRLWAAVGAAGQDVPRGALTALATSLFRAADDATSALTQGYERAQHRTLRREEAVRREFVEDLLTGRGAGPEFQARAARFGFLLASRHVVVVAATAEPVELHGPVHARLEAAATARHGHGDVLVATRSGHAVVVLPATAVDPGAQVLRWLDQPGWRVGVGEPHAGPGGVARSYQEARTALDLARRAHLDEPLADYRRLLPLRLLIHDPGLTAELVGAVLDGLGAARGGAGPLVATLEAFFHAGLNVTATARELHLTPRGVLHRLESIHRLTGYDPRDPDDRFALEMAVRAARLSDHDLG